MKKLKLARVNKAKTYAEMADKLAADILALDTTGVAFDGLVDNAGRAQKRTVPFENYIAWRRQHYVPHDVQRDHDTRVATGKLDHVIKQFELLHAVVTLAHFKGQYKWADANGRSILWDTPETVMDRPKDVELVILYCETQAEFDGVYNCIDSSVSRKNAGDNLFGLMRGLGVAAKLDSNNRRFKLGAFQGALRYVNEVEGRSKADMVGALKAYGDEVALLSKLPRTRSRSRFPNLLLAVGLVLAKRRALYLAEYLDALYDSYNDQDGETPDVDLVFSDLAKTVLGKTEDLAAVRGCLRGQLGKDGIIPKLAAPLLDFYAEYESSRLAQSVMVKRARKRA